ncbi:hypothetical protein R5N98_08810 [Tenacibaculum maritimum]|uniref:hypothetical protein n=1 Tax=Tenacibaculum maritimum TaxID=107401 RepID=UPI0012E475B3|nr:hypothetical protein [Tenacibaculum maritimum]CAA0200522.1 conserved hypothetical protein [Tenacibaculum maritimum]CAA0246235.1 conserved hypothetical protein [Tenacibaculum maritimum]
MAENPIIPEKIKLFNIEVVNTYINDDTIDDNLNLEFSIAHNTKHNLKDERVKIELFINLLSQEDIGIKFHIDFHFVIKDLSDQYKLNEVNAPVFSYQFIATLLGISFSTARGLIFQQLQDTNFKGMILPVVSPYRMLASRNE